MGFFDKKSKTEIKQTFRTSTTVNERNQAFSELGGGVAVVGAVEQAFEFARMESESARASAADLANIAAAQTAASREGIERVSLALAAPPDERILKLGQYAIAVAGIGVIAWAWRGRRRG